MSNTRASERRVAVSLAALDRTIDQTMVLPTETVLKGRDRVEWGTRNRYPDYLCELYDTVTTMRTIIDGTVDFIVGDDLVLAPRGEAVRSMNAAGVTPREQVGELARNLELYGGFAVQVIRNRVGGVAELHALDLRFVRTNKDNSVFYYSEDWAKARTDAVVYPAFIPFTVDEWAALDDDTRNRHASSVLFVKATGTKVYPVPRYAAALKDCEIERNIEDFHLNSLENGFVSSAVINFNNGVPEDAIKEEIERDINEKFSGHQNAGRIVISWNRDKESATTIDTPKVEDFGERYKALATHSRQQIFAAFRAVPALFGIMTETTGFSEQEFEQAFRLYNRTRVRPAQRLIADAYDKVFGAQGVLTITPFTLDGADTKVD